VEKRERTCSAMDGFRGFRSQDRKVEEKKSACFEKNCELDRERECATKIGLFVTQNSGLGRFGGRVKVAPQLSACIISQWLHGAVLSIGTSFKLDRLVNIILLIVDNCVVRLR
jgi:hypothetical protein